ncbi:alpha/beta hydrolase [Corynebacterium callunae]|uniref:alpha/beta fold hydrolase n=1 Tax=Corynebacterium callunae TaxID=1721 RepID=UPI003982B524
MSSNNNVATSADGTKISYVKSGTGPALVITHGSIASKEQWAPAIHELEKDFTCFVYDRRGRGDNPNATNYSIQNEIDDLHVILKEAGENASILAHSYGALCALEYSLAHPLGDRKMILFEPPLPVNEPIAGEALLPYKELIEAGEDDAALRFGLLNFVRSSEEEVNGASHSPLWPSLVQLAPTWVRELERMDQLSDDLSRFSVLSGSKVSLLVGTTTSDFLKIAANGLAETVDNIVVIEMPGLDHLAHVMDPVSFSEFVKEAYNGS